MTLDFRKFAPTGFDPQKHLTQADKDLVINSLEALDLELARRDFGHFLFYVKVMEPPPGRGILNFERWDHLVEVCETLETERLIVWLKSRQTGASWLLAAYALWTALYQTGALVLLLSQGEDEAKILLGKSRFIYEQLPDALKTPQGIDSRQQMTFPSKHSGINALPSTEKAGRSVTATLVIMDEADFHEHLEANYAAVKPTIDDGGGKLIMVSTSNAASSVSLFKQTYKEAPYNGFKSLFYGWNVRPGRDNAWFSARQAEYSNASLFEKEYPATAEEALSPPRTLAAFDHDKLKLMSLDVRKPVVVPAVGATLANIYQEYQPGKRYAAATDTAHGTGGDYAVTVILDTATGYVVADIQNNLIPPDQLALASIELLHKFGNPVWAIEDNEWGALTISTAINLHYPRLFYRDDGKKAGWHTDERSRYVLWGELIEAVASRLITIPSEEGLGQFYSVIRNPEKGGAGGGRIEAQKGANDDYPMAVGIAWQMRKFARASTAGTGDGSPTARPGVSERLRTLVRW